MKQAQFINIIGMLTKVMIFLICYIGTHFVIFLSTAFVFNEFEENYGEAIEGIVLGTVIFAPLMLVFLLPFSLIIFKLVKRMHYLSNDWFIVIWGIALAIFNILINLTPIRYAFLWVLSFILE